MSDLPALDQAASRHGLFVAGVAPLRPGDGIAPRFRTVVLLAPEEPAFWDVFSASPEMRDGAPHPLDRWSRRIIGQIACERGSKAVFPFQGPPWRPFTDWARRSGQAWPSPVGLLVHRKAGLWISYRGGVLLEEEPPPPSGSAFPCESCLGQPCRTACPVEAMKAEEYDVPACHAVLDTASGHDCLTAGCRVRRACPVGAGRRAPEQSAFHMKAFHPA